MINSTGNEGQAGRGRTSSRVRTSRGWIHAPYPIPTLLHFPFPPTHDTRWVRRFPNLLLRRRRSRPRMNGSLGPSLRCRAGGSVSPTLFSPAVTERYGLVWMVQCDWVVDGCGQGTRGMCRRLHQLVTSGGLDPRVAHHPSGPCTRQQADVLGRLLIPSSASN